MHIYIYAICIYPELSAIEIPYILKQDRLASMHAHMRIKLMHLSDVECIYYYALHCNIFCNILYCNVFNCFSLYNVVLHLIVLCYAVLISLAIKISVLILSDCYEEPRKVGLIGLNKKLQLYRCTCR